MWEMLVGMNEFNGLLEREVERKGFYMMVVSKNFSLFL